LFLLCFHNLSNLKILKTLSMKLSKSVHFLLTTYTFEQDGKKKMDYINFEALLVKDGPWKIMMEYQKSKATKEDWDKLVEL
jgi:hypothetical protein